MKSVWVFHAEGAAFAGGIFEAREIAEQWIARHQLSGVLTEYPVGVGVYEWAVKTGVFAPKKEMTARLIGGFTSAAQDHYHYTDGVNRDKVARG